MADPQFLDDNGNPIYLDDSGNVIGTIDPSKLKVGSSTKSRKPDPGGSFETTGWVTQFKPNKPVDINQRPDSSMFSISDEGKQSYRDSVARNLGEGTFPTWLGELPLTGLEMFSTPESLAVPSFVNRMGRPGIPKIPSVGAPPLPKQKLLPEASSMQMGPITPQSIEGGISRINTPPSTIEGIRGPSGRMVKQGRFVQQPDQGMLDVNTRKVYTPEGKLVPQGPAKTVKLEGSVIDEATGEVIPELPKADVSKVKAPLGSNVIEGELAPQPEVIPKFSPKGQAQEPASLQDKLNNLLTELAKSEEGSLDLDKLRQTVSGKWKSRDGGEASDLIRERTAIRKEVMKGMPQEIRMLHESFRKTGNIEELSEYWQKATKWLEEQGLYDAEAGGYIPDLSTSKELANKPGYKNIGNLFKEEEGSLDIGKLFGRGKGKEDDFSTSVRNALGKAITSGGRVDLNEIYSKIGKGKDRGEFDNIVSRMIDSGEAKKLIEGDLNIPLMPIEPIETQSKARQYWDFFRGVKSVDLPFISSAALRQGNYYIGTKAWREQFGKAARAYGSQKAFDAQEAERLTHPYFAPQKHYGKTGKLIQDQSSFAEMAGLRRGGAGFQDDIVQKRELAERIPWYGGHVHRNNRAFTAAVNHLSDTAFTNMVDDFKAIGLDPTKDLTLAREIAELVNTSVKRGTLGLDVPNLKPGQGKNILAEKSLERSISTISGLLFSPRGISSDMRLLNPSTYWNAPGPVRKELIKGMGRRMSIWLGVAGLAKAGGAEVNLQPTNPDFLKIKIGNTRIDPPAGLQQFIVLAAQNYEGGKTSSNTGKFSQFGQGFTPTRSENALNFLVNRQHPALRNMWDMGSGSPNDPVHIFDRALRMFTPMFSDDVAGAAFEDPELIPIILLLGGGGLGTQTYEKGDKMNAPVYLPEDWDVKFPGGK